MNGIASLIVFGRRLEQLRVLRPGDRHLLNQTLQVLEELDNYADLQRLLTDALTRLLEQSLRRDESFDTLRQDTGGRAAACGLDLAAKQPDAQTVIRDIDHYIDIEAAAVERCARNLSDRPIFIFSMPRSGATLTEQILASHPDVQAAGERRFWRGLNCVRLSPYRAARTR